MGGQRWSTTSHTLLNITVSASATVYPPELTVLEDLIAEDSAYWSQEHGEIKRVLNWKLLPC